MALQVRSLDSNGVQVRGAKMKNVLAKLTLSY